MQGHIGYQNTGPNPYELPAGKEYHIFIACSGIDSRKGKWLLQQLEARYPMRCVYHERDFHPGAMIVDNIREYIDKSVKVLLLISNGFLQSYHCKLEETFAMSLSNETGRNCIIPVLLEDVELPPVLRHMTYIDARIDGDVVAQIREAYCRTANQVGMLPNLCAIGGDDNGKRIGVIEGRRYSRFCGCRWKFDDFNVKCIASDAETRRHMDEMFIEVMSTLNDSPGTRCYGIFTPYRQLCGLFLFLFVYAVIICCSFIYPALTEENYDYGSVVFIPLIVGVSVFPTLYWMVFRCIGSRVSAKYIEKVLWDVVKRHYKKSKCLVFYDNLPIGCCNFMCGFSNKFELVVIHYDTAPCKEYILLYLRNKFRQFAHNHEAFEEWADKLIENTVAFYSHDIIHWEDLPTSNYNRHEMWKQRVCICQLVEPHLSGLSPGQHIWFTNLSKREHKTFSNGTVDYSRTIIL